MLKLLLEYAGFHAGEAVELATGSCSPQFDVIVLGVNMPTPMASGRSAELRACEDCTRTRIAFHSAEDEDMVRARFASCDDFLKKPVDDDRLIERIKGLAETPAHEGMT